ncbi:MAG: amino acid ABC transporter ATP-binding protein [Verrucomicrobiota bacterium]
MIHVEHLSKRFNGHAVLHDVCLRVEPSECVVLLGPSGSGKSTLLRCINLLETPDAGRVAVGDVAVDCSRPVPREAQRQLRLRAGMVFQHFHLFPHLDVLDNVVAGPVHVRGIPRAEAEAHAMEWLGRVGMAAMARRLPSQLSGGQQQRVAIARALAMNPDALLLDEPTSALDPALRGEVADVLRSLADAGTTMLLVTHDLRLAREAADRIVVLHAGCIVESGPPGRVLDNPSHEATRQLLA